MNESTEGIIAIPADQIPAQIPFTNPHLAVLNSEADSLMTYLKNEDNMADPGSLVHRLNEIDTLMARLSEMLIQAKSMEKYAKARFDEINAKALEAMKATSATRVRATCLFEFTLTSERLESVYKTMDARREDLRSKISYVREQMHYGI